MTQSGPVCDYRIICQFGFLRGPFWVLDAFILFHFICICLRGQGQTEVAKDPMPPEQHNAAKNKKKNAKKGLMGTSIIVQRGRYRTQGVVKKNTKYQTYLNNCYTLLTWLTS